MEEKNFGKRLRELRKQAGMTQRELAGEVGVDFSYLSKIENGVLPPPSEKVISKLAESLNTSRDELLSLAGRIPSEISELLTRPEALKFLRSQRGQKALGTSKRKPGGLQMRGKDFFKNYKSLARAAVAVVLVLAVGTSLWFAAPAQALTTTITNPTSGTLGSTYTFTVKVDVEDVDLLPIQSVKLYIYKTSDRATYEATCTDLPLNDGTKTYADTGNGAVSVTAETAAGWGYDSGTRYGYGYALPAGTTITHPLGTDYGYGYGYGTLVGATSITYNVTWTSPSGWPAGGYTIETKVYGSSTTYFPKTSTEFTLSAAGGGGGPAPTPAPAPGTTDVSGSVDEEGEFTADVTATSGDANVEITINEGTTGLTKEGEPITEITMPIMTDPPAQPAASNVVGLVYDLGPDGATFAPPITLTFTYDESLIPAGVAEENLILAVWDEDAGAWVNLECTVDPATNTITAEVSHFTAFTVVAHTSPAAFAASNLSVTPAEVGIGEEVTISALITNSGDLTDSYEAVLKIDGAEVAMEEVTLIGSASETVTFTTTRDAAGTYTVSVNGLSGTFTVKAAPAPPAPAPPTPPPTPPAEPINWPLIGGIIAGVIVVALVIWRVGFRRRD